MNRTQSQELLSPKPSTLTVRLAQTAEEIDQAFQLRYRVFVEEEKNMQLRNADNRESDRFDAYCEHLIVLDEVTQQVVGTYRMLPGDRTEEIGFYSETEFDLGPFDAHRRRTLELGRSCVAPEYRSGRSIHLLWEGIAAYIDRHGYDYMIGCASMRMTQLEQVNEIYTALCNKGILTNRHGVRPLPSHTIAGLTKLDHPKDERTVFRMMPPLVKGYQYLGAEIAGDPAYDAVFGTIDLFVLLSKENVERRYRKHFMPDAPRS